MKKLNYLILLILFSIGHSYGQGSATISGIVTSLEGEALPFATVTLFKDSVLLTGTMTDTSGKFAFTQLLKGIYQVEVQYVGMQTTRIDHVFLSAFEIKSIPIILNESVTLESVLVTSYRVPLLSANSVGLSRSNSTSGSIIRGSRAGATNYYIDGIRISGNPNPGMKTRQQRRARQPRESQSEEYQLINENRFHRTVDAPLSTFSIDVDAASYSTIRRHLTNGQLPPKDAVRIEEMINYFRYDYPQPVADDPVRMTDQLGPCPWNKDHYLLRIGLASRRLDMDSLPPANLVFLIDVSGSMQDVNKLPLLKQAFRLLVMQLRPMDKVAMVVYAGSAGLVLKPTSGDQKDIIQDALNRLEAGGSTAGGAGITLAYQTARDGFIEQGNNRIILATDGDFNVGMSSDADMVRLIETERESGVFLSVLGFGVGNYKDSKMQQLADAGNGNHFYIDHLDEAKRVFVQEFGSSLFTVAKDVKLQIEFNPTRVAGYRLIGYENRMLEQEDFDDDKKDAGDMGTGHSVTALYEIVPAHVKKDSALVNTRKLRYQLKRPSLRSINQELAIVKFRYKAPDRMTSRLLTHTILNEVSSEEDLSLDFKWSAIVAGFGLLLRESPYQGTLSFDSLLTYMEEHHELQADPARKELFGLVKQAATLADISAH